VGGCASATDRIRARVLDGEIVSGATLVSSRGNGCATCWRACREPEVKELGGVETKAGGSRYLPGQRAKDEWLKQNSYPVNVVRKPKK
jgi:hypothetical protein